MHQTQSVRTTRGDVVNRRKGGSVSCFVTCFWREMSFVLGVTVTRDFCHRVFILKGLVLRCVTMVDCFVSASQRVLS